MHLLGPGIERVAHGLATLGLLVFSDDLGLHQREQAVEAAQHRQRLHHALVLRREVRPTQEVDDTR